MSTENRPSANLDDIRQALFILEQDVQESGIDLEKLMASPDVSKRQLKAIRTWLDKQTGKPAGSNG